MKKTLLLLALVVASTVAMAQKPYMVAFYNLENLFDLYNDPDTHDDEFTPEGEKQWNQYKYDCKMANIERVLFDMAAIQKDYPIVIGVTELENRLVLEDVVALPKLAPAKYRICHFDSPDARGIDVAFLYRADVFKMEGCDNRKLIVPENPTLRTRDLVIMWGTIDDEPFCFLVSHWPSRRGGQYASAYLREACARQIREIKDEFLAKDPNTKFVAMGDFNDDATDKSVEETLGAKGKMKQLVAGDFFNPFNEMLRAGLGTLAYQDKWNLFDNIVVTENLATGSTGKLKLQKAPKSKYYGNIFNRPYLIQQEGQYKGYPLRTFVGNNFQNGFSDHLPVYIYIGK